MRSWDSPRRSAFVGVSRETSADVRAQRESSKRLSVSPGRRFAAHSQWPGQPGCRSALRSRPSQASPRPREIFPKAFALRRRSTPDEVWPPAIPTIACSGGATSSSDGPDKLPPEQARGLEVDREWAFFLSPETVNKWRALSQSPTEFMVAQPAGQCHFQGKVCVIRVSAARLLRTDKLEA
jgi:hypothetical protein